MMMKQNSNKVGTALVIAIGALVSAYGINSAKASAFPTLDPARNFAVLALGGDVQQSGPLSPNSGYNIDGNVGVASSGYKYQGSGSVTISGNFYINSGSTFSTSSSGARGSVIQNSATDAMLASARTAAFNTSALFAGMAPNQTFGTLSGNMTISQSNVGQYIFNVSAISLSGNDLITLSAPAGSSFVLNITGGFSLSGSSHIQLAGGLTPADVLYNALGTGNVAFSGGGNSSGVDGIILAIERNIQLSPALIRGEVIGASISMSSGAGVVGVVPEMNSAWMIVGLVGLMLLGSLRRFVRRPLAQKAV